MFSPSNYLLTNPEVLQAIWHNYLGLSVETVSRVLGRMQKDNIISIYSKSVELRELERPAEISVKCNDSRITAKCTAP